MATEGHGLFVVQAMRRVDRDEELDAAFRDASSEAERAFGNPSVYVEKLIERIGELLAV